MAAVVYRATWLWRIVDRAKILPLRGTHLVAGLSVAWGIGSEERNDNRVDILTEEAAQFIQPE